MDQPFPSINEFPLGQTTVQHIYHHYENDGARVTAKVERNSKGYNWEASVSGAKTVDEAMALLAEAEKNLRSKFGPKEIVDDGSDPMIG
jgi:hypothetical protein